ncbi:MAG TPA: PDZ domain-containing protein [Gemmataceae bacterium]|nr:PDZ domain-containing protein [Gemmataceae bacterium]
MKVRWLLVALLFVSPVAVHAQEKKNDAKPGFVPFRLTDTHHTLVRVKINGKGPFNFIVDTGCPVLLIAEPVGKQAGLETKNGWAVLDRLELEGGLDLTKVKARVETPFQITGMNRMGLAGVELHGLMGYTVLAKYKMQFDYTKKQMAWTPLAFEPPPPAPLGKKAATGGMNAMVAMVEIMSLLVGNNQTPPPQPRGFFGFELSEKDKLVQVADVLPNGPAAKAGLQKDDRIVEANGKEITSISTLMQEASKITAGKTLALTIERKGKNREIKITAGDGL